MAKITKRIVESLKPHSVSDKFLWDSELRGFGVRLKPSGVASYIVQYRNQEYRTRRLVLGQHGRLTAEQARIMARERLGEVARGNDPSAERHAAREAPSVAQLCDWYLEEARAGRLLGRRRRPLKASTLEMDASRIALHIKPHLGHRLVEHLTLLDVEGLQAKIAAGQSVTRRPGRGGQTTGGSGVAARSVATLRAVFGHAHRLGLIDGNPAAGARLLASDTVKRRLSEAEIRRLGKAMRAAAADGENPTGLAAIELMLLTGFRRMEVLGLMQDWVARKPASVMFPDTKTGPQVRPIGKAAMRVIDCQARKTNGLWLFPADIGEGHFIGVVRVLARVCAQAGLTDVTPHTLRHTFASVAGDLNFSELTIRGLLGHAGQGVTQRYVHLDQALVLAADQTAEKMRRLLGSGIPR
jgi:integrase